MSGQFQRRIQNPVEHLGWIFYLEAVTFAISLFLDAWMLYWVLSTPLIATILYYKMHCAPLLENVNSL